MSDEFPTGGRIAAVDYGTVRIGIALTDPSRSFASPYENYTRGDAAADAKRFQRLVEEEQIVGFVIGLPLHGGGEESQKSIEARRFGKWLAEQTSLPVCYHDERFTSIEAERYLSSAKLTKKQRKKRLDMLAAQIILASFIESAGAERQNPGPLED